MHSARCTLHAASALGVGVERRRLLHEASCMHAPRRSSQLLWVRFASRNASSSAYSVAAGAGGRRSAQGELHVGHLALSIIASLDSATARPEQFGTDGILPFGHAMCWSGSGGACTPTRMCPPPKGVRPTEWYASSGVRRPESAAAAPARVSWHAKHHTSVAQQPAGFVSLLIRKV